MAKKKGAGDKPQSFDESNGQYTKESKRAEAERIYDTTVHTQQPIKTYKQLKDVKSARNYFLKISDLWVKKLTEDEIDGIRGYTDYRSYNINDDLRKGLYDKSKWKDQIQKIDSAISKFDLPDDIMVYRGTNIMEFGKQLNDFEDMKSLEGRTIALPAFTSTSTKIDIADKEFDGEIIVQLKVKKGIGKGAYVDYLTYMNPDNEEDRESEFLLKRNSQLKIKKVSQRDDGKIIVEAEA